jgi:hypothetical protein
VYEEAEEASESGRRQSEDDGVSGSISGTQELLLNDEDVSGTQEFYDASFGNNTAALLTSETEQVELIRRRLSSSSRRTREVLDYDGGGDLAINEEMIVEELTDKINAKMEQMEERIGRQFLAPMQQELLILIEGMKMQSSAFENSNNNKTTGKNGSGNGGGSKNSLLKSGLGSAAAVDDEIASFEQEEEELVAAKKAKEAVVVVDIKKKEEVSVVGVKKGNAKGEAEARTVAEVVDDSKGE